MSSSNQSKSRKWTIIVIIALVIFVVFTWPKPVEREQALEAVQPDLDTAGLSPEVQAQLMAAYDSIALSFATVEPIFDRSCYDCHSHRDKLPWYFKMPVVNGMMRDHISEGREHLDFTGGFPFRGKGNQRELLNDMKEEIDEHKMPLESYLWMHSDAKLEGPVFDSVMAWINHSHELIVSVYASNGAPMKESPEATEHEHEMGDDD